MMRDLIDKALSLLRKEEIVAAPTDTVYGLFGDATSDIAVQKIYKAKNRPLCNPLIIHVSSIGMARNYVAISQEQEDIIKDFWESSRDPITFIVPSSSNSKISNLVTTGLDTLAIRMPNHYVALEIISKFGKPLAAPSANTSTKISPTTAGMVLRDLGDRIPLVIDAGECAIGIESSILDITKKPYRILRHGGVSLEVIEAKIGQKILEGMENSTIKAPGMMKKHYSPSLRVRLNAAFPMPGEAFVAFGETAIKYDFNLSKLGDLTEAARNLFVALQYCDDKERFTGIAVMPIPQKDLGRAINDRLERASN